MNLAKFCLKTTHPDQDETKRRLSKNYTNETRLSKKISSETRPRRDKFQNFVLDRDETESLGTFSLETETETETLVLHCFSWGTTSIWTSGNASHDVRAFCLSPLFMSFIHTPPVRAFLGNQDTGTSEHRDIGALWQWMGFWYPPTTTRPDTVNSTWSCSWIGMKSFKF